MTQKICRPPFVISSKTSLEAFFSFLLPHNSKYISAMYMKHSENTEGVYVYAYFNSQISISCFLLDTLEFLINMSTQICMSSGKNPKKLCWCPISMSSGEKIKVYQYEFGTNSLIDFLNSCAISIHIH